jgi:hypothetical protein
MIRTFKTKPTISAVYVYPVDGKTVVNQSKRPVNKRWNLSIKHCNANGITS